MNLSSSQNSKAKYTRNLSPTRLKPALIFSWLRLHPIPVDGVRDAATVKHMGSTVRNMDVSSNQIDCCTVVP